MGLHTVLSALVSGIAAFLVVGVAVTELLGSVVGFSLFVGIPVGVLAAVVVAAFVLVGSRPGAAGGRRRAALAVSGFSVTFLVVAVLGVLLGFRNSVALLVAAVLGAFVAVGSYLLQGRQTDDGPLDAWNEPR